LTSAGSTVLGSNAATATIGLYERHWYRRRIHMLRHESIGYLNAFSLLVVDVMLLPLMAFQTVVLLKAGVEIPLEAGLSLSLGSLFCRSR
jgi:hypothetical protein